MMTRTQVKMLFAVLVVGFCAASIVSAAELRWVKSATADLNGDGKSDRISISIPKDPDPATTYTLRVNGTPTHGELDQGVVGFAVVDLDGSDHYKEIVVHTDGPSDDPAYKIYWYDGKRTREVGHLQGGAAFVGGGIVYANDWHGSWSQREKYVLDKKTHTLRLVPQSLYWIDEKVTVSESFPIYRSPTDAGVVANLRPGSRVLLVATPGVPRVKPRAGAKRVDRGQEEADGYMSTWFLIKSESNLMGWARLQTLYAKTSDMPMAD